MHVKKINAKLNSLNKLMKIVESRKNITLINILKLSQRINHFYHHALSSRQLIEQLQSEVATNDELFDEGFLRKILNKTLAKKQNSNFENSIWIYVTEEEQYSTNSYFKHEQFLSQNIKKNDLLITIGQRAINFALENKFNVIFEYPENNVEVLSEVLPNFLEYYLQQFSFYNVKFIINSTKLKGNFFEVLPINKLNFELPTKKEINLNLNFKKMKIYPSVDEFISSELNSYLTYITLTLLSESSLIYLKYKLVAENQKIHDLEKKFKQMRLKMLRGKRELEVEQLSLLSKKKDLLHSEKKLVVQEEQHD
ncbi:MSC_0622 family F1-like ATPase gamma subunit [Mycoplasmopsis gallopavonis]|uniref:ATP synthase gamma chain n=1 Tax=Mycoplasmopsis gallopavonis TaxID=76629 RepID=A0A449B0F1_9BACT|nr:hypothetical protein [Mycoplasmopsis gallopavonis]RIV16312.1 hypothetical protein D1113_02860 [Mycoplasmopsis gallopavonis]VEU73235.1 Uncharacterised protein [Mycoplasmopsis gallopavonis]